ncbi:hypothetical protein EfmJHP36_31120 (plasmid) [Enterococcus faecium]|nr:hypothetical protein EfmJHP36_31120 [Enterococcus faecium]
MNHFKGKQFQQDVIIVAVGYYLRYIVNTEKYLVSFFHDSHLAFLLNL